MKPGFILDSYLSFAGNFETVCITVDHILSKDETTYARLFAFGQYGVANIAVWRV